MLNIERPNYKKIAVWNTAFLGDAILTLPLIQTLRGAYPDATIDYYVRKGVGSLFRSSSFINSVHEYDKSKTGGGVGGIFALGKVIRKEQYDLWISSHTSMRSGLVAKLSGVKRRIGYKSPWYNKICYTNLVDRRFTELQEIERLMQLVLPLSIKDSAPWPELELPQSAYEFADGLVFQSSNPVLGIHPGSVWPTKRWPEKYFAEIALMALSLGARVILFAGPGEERVASHVIDLLNKDSQFSSFSKNFINLSGKLNLVNLAATLGRLSCYLTNDSGPMHMAWVQRTPVVALFGPTVRDLGFIPRGDSAIMENEGLSCRPCGLHGHKKCPQGHFLCMNDLTPEIVWPEVSKRLFK